MKVNNIAPSYINLLNEGIVSDSFANQYSKLISKIKTDIKWDDKPTEYTMPDMQVIEGQFGNITIAFNYLMPSKDPILTYNQINWVFIGLLIEENGKDYISKFNKTYTEYSEAQDDGSIDTEGKLITYPKKDFYYWQRDNLKEFEAAIDYVKSLVSSKSSVKLTESPVPNQTLLNIAHLDPTSRNILISCIASTGLIYGRDFFVQSDELFIANYKLDGAQYAILMAYNIAMPSEPSAPNKTYSVSIPDDDINEGRLINGVVRAAKGVANKTKSFIGRYKSMKNKAANKYREKYRTS